MDEITERVMQLLKEITKTDREINPSDDLRNDIGLTSYEAMVLFFTAENCFNVKFDYSRLIQIVTVKDLCAMINQLCEGK